MTLIPKWKLTTSKDVSYVQYKDITGEYDAKFNPNGYGVLTVGKNGTVNSDSEIVTLSAHGLSNADYVLITALSSETFAKIGCIYKVDYVSSTKFRLDINGDYAGLADGTTISYKVLIEPINKPLHSYGVIRTEVQISTLDNNQEFSLVAFDSTTSEFFPQIDNPVNITYEEVTGIDGAFPDKIYLSTDYIWYPLSILSISTDEAILKLANDGSKKQIVGKTSNTKFEINNNLTSYGDTPYVKVFGTSSGKSLITGINRGVSGANFLVLTAALTELTVEEDVLVYVGYKINNYFVADAEVKLCLSKAIVQVDIDDCCNSCEECVELGFTKLSDIYTTLIAIKEQAKQGMYNEASKNLIAINKYCTNCCSCDE